MPAGFALPKLRYLVDRPSVADQPQLWTSFALWNDPYLAQMYGFAWILSRADILIATHEPRVSERINTCPNM